MDTTDDYVHTCRGCDRMDTVDDYVYSLSAHADGSAYDVVHSCDECGKERNVLSSTHGCLETDGVVELSYVLNHLPLKCSVTKKVTCGHGGVVGQIALSIDQSGVVRSKMTSV